MTRAQAESRLAERGMRLEEIPGGFMVMRPKPDRDAWGEHYDARDLVSRGPTYQWAYAEATGEAPFGCGLTSRNQLLGRARPRRGTT